jgi:hypothetical protein
MKVSRSIFAVLLAAVMAVLPVACTSAQVQDTISTASAVLSSASAILTPIDPQLGSVLSAASSAFTDVGKAYSDYLAAAAADQGQKAAALRAALSAIQGNLAQLLSDLQVRHPELVEYITVAVAVANSAVILIVSHIGTGATASASTVRATAQTSSLPVVAGAKSAKDLRAAWNNKVKVAFPSAVI